MKPLRVHIFGSAALAVSIALVLCGCPRPVPELNPAKYASPTPGAQKMPQENIEPAMTDRVMDGMQPPLDPSPTPGDETLDLTDLLDVALRNNPNTRAAWAQAKMSAADWARSRSAYYPWVDGQVEGEVGQIAQVQQLGRSYIQLGVGVSYMLLDFGRGAKAEAARHALVAANWNHNQSIQDVLKNVPQSYYTHLASKALVLATEKNLQEAMTTLKATEERLRAGVSTISDVLQARAQEAKVKLDLVQNKGDAEISKGGLATAVGWPANAPLTITDSLGDPPIHKLGTSVDGLIAEAKQNRPDIGAAQAYVKQKRAEMEKARALPFPTLSSQGTFGWLKARNLEQGAYYGGLTLSIPIFHGFDMENALRSARADLEAAEAELQLMQEDVIQQVWDAYQNYRTAAESMTASRALLASASESYDASLARYKVGAADIVELLNAQSTLADARSQLISSKSQVYTSYAELVHAVGESVPEEGIDEKDEVYGEDR